MVRCGYATCDVDSRQWIQLLPFSLSVEHQSLMRVVMLIPGILILPCFPRQWKIKEGLEKACAKMCSWPWFRSFLYDFIKGGGAIACFYGSNYLGSFFKALADWRIIHASLTYILFLLALDFLYDFEEVLEICDNFVLAGYGLMINANHQKIISMVVVHITCGFLCVLKTFLRSNLKLFHRMILGQETQQDQLPTTTDTTQANSGSASHATLDPHGRRAV